MFFINKNGIVRAWSNNEEHSTFGGLDVKYPNKFATRWEATAFRDKIRAKYPRIFKEELDLCQKN